MRKILILTAALLVVTGLLSACSSGPSQPNSEPAKIPPGSTVTTPTSSGTTPIPAAPAPTVARKTGELPNGFAMKTAAGGTGRLITTTLPLSPNVDKVLVSTLDSLANYFDSRPLVVAAFQDVSSKGIQGTFTASLNKKAVRGIVFAFPGENDIVLNILYDYTETFSTSYDSLIALTKPADASLVQSPKDLQWKDIQFPDGSGSIRLPQGWQLSSSTKGMMTAAGPNGAKAEMGIWFTVNEPNPYSRSIPGSDRLIWAAYAPPDKALISINNEIRRIQGQAADNTLKVVEQVPTAAPGGGSAAFLHVTYENNGVLSRGLAWVSTARTGPTQWVYYISQLTAPDREFKRQYLVMQEIWKGYAVSGKLIQERLETATKDMKEIGQIIQSVQNNRERAQADANYNWTEYIRGETFMKDTQMNEVSTQSLQYVNQLVKGLNQQEGYQRYQVLPMREYYNSK
jgi:hypothetical protein